MDNGFYSYRRQFCASAEAAFLVWADIFQARASLVNRVSHVQRVYKYLLFLVPLTATALPGRAVGHQGLLGEGELQALLLVDT